MGSKTVDMTFAAHFRCPVFALLIATALGGCTLLTPDGESVGTSPAAESLVNMGDFAAERGQLSSAIGLYRQAISADPTSVSATTRLGETLGQANRYPEAVAAFRRGTTLDPNNPRILRGLGNVLIAQGRPAQAMEPLGQALAVEPDPRTLNSLGVAHDLLGQHEEAQAIYRQAIALDSADPDVIGNLALSLSLDGQHDLAVQTAQSASVAPNAAPRHRHTLALVQGLAGRREDAANTARLDMPESDVTQLLQGIDQLMLIDDSTLRAASILRGNVSIAP